MRVQLGYSNHLSPIEKIVLRAIGASKGGVGVEQLVHLFKLSERVTTDLLGDLLRRRYIVLDFHSARVRLEQGVTMDRLDELQPAERFNDYTDLVIERLAGCVLPAGDAVRRIDDGGLELPVSVSEPRENPSETELLAVLEPAIEQENKRREADGRPRRAHRVLAARLSLDQQPRIVEHRWLALEVGVRFDEDTELLRFTMTDRRLSVAQRASAVKRLNKLVSDRPTTKFVQALKGVAERRRAEPPGLTELLAQFVKHTAEAASAPAGTRISRHGVLTYEYHQVVNQIRARQAAEVIARPVVGAEAHQELLVELIGSAREQLVLACPVVRYDLLNKFFDPIESALAEGVQVVLVWGKNRDAALDDKVRTALSSLRWGGEKRMGARLMVSTMPSRINAAVVVADDRRALVTGHHFLADEGADRRQVGVDMTAPHDEACPAIESLLVWTRRVLRHREGRLMHVRHSEFAGGQPKREPSLPDAGIEPPEPPPDSVDGELAASRVQLWAGRWQAVSGHLQQTMEARALPWAEVVEDGVHRELFWDALRRPAHRLVLSGHLLHPGALDDRVLSALRKRSADGTDVTIVHQRSTAAGTGRDASGVLRELVSEVPLNVVRDATNARVLVGDDELVVTSFDFLGTAGHVSGLPHQGQSEVGIRLVGRAVTEEFADALGQSSATLPEAAPTTTVWSPVSPATQHMLDAVAAAPPGGMPDVVAEHLADGPDLWPMLADLRGASVPVDLLRVAVAGGLRRSAAGLDSAEAQQWLEWLMGERWSNRAFAEAAVLRMGIRDPGLAPQPEFALMAAARGGPTAGRAIAGAWNDGLTESERSVLAVVAAVEILLHDGNQAHRNDLMTAEVPDLVSLLDVGEPFAAVTAAAHDYWQTQKFAALPVDSIEVAGTHAAHSRSVDKAWQRLVAAVEQGQRPQTGFERTHRHLFGSDGVFGHVVEAVGKRDVAAVRRWVAGEGAADIGKLIDKATAVAAPGNDLVTGGRRRNYADRLTRIVHAAQRLASLPMAAVGMDTDHRLESAVRFAKSLAAVWSSVREAQPDGPEGVLLAAALDDIEFVVRWGNHD
nr:hypothetical protein [Kibdelosporangium sp. MJ126-NF4]